MLTGPVVSSISPMEWMLVLIFLQEKMSQLSSSLQLKTRHIESILKSSSNPGNLYLMWEKQQQGWPCPPRTLGRDFVAFASVSEESLTVEM